MKKTIALLTVLLLMISGTSLLQSCSDDGFLTIEAESGNAEGNWSIHESADAYGFLTGYSGEGCIHFIGNTEVSGPPDSPITFLVKIKTPGVYRVKMRALEAPLETGEGDKANDCYLKLEGAEGWLGEFTKFVLLGESYFWDWNVMGEPRHHEFEAPEYNLEKGVYNLQIAGRSKNFFIDKIVLYRIEDYTEEEVMVP